MASNDMYQGCFSSEDFDKYTNRVEVVFPRVKRRYLHINGYNGDEYIDLYDVFTLRDRTGRNLKGRIHDFQQFLVEFRDGHRFTPRRQTGITVVWFQDNMQYDKNQRYNVTFHKYVRAGVEVGMFELIPVILTQQDLNLEEVD